MYFIASSIASSSKLPVSAPYTFSLKLPFLRENSGDYHVNPFLPGCPRIPLHVELRGYQKQAITSWFANN
ncbi:MAG: helicase, partial [Cylindrospermopsis raciborskii]